METTTNRRIYLLGIPFLLLLIPALGMLVSSEVNWSPFDFLVAAVLLYGTVFLIDFVLRKIESRKKRFLLVAICLILVIALWIELAVGLFGSPIAGS
jgi:hypothetical protein